MSLRGDPRVITEGAEVRERLMLGAEKVYKAVSPTYGPSLGTVALQRSYGNPIVSKDGITVARDVFLRDEIEDTGAGFVVQASQKSADTSGDGTSCSIILSYHLMKLANQRIAAGFNPVGLRKGIEKASLWAKEELDKLAIPVADKDLAKVAAISASDEEVGKLVADTVLKVGGVGITVENYDGLGVTQEIVEGLYFDRGWTMPHFVTDRTTEEAIHNNPSILILEKKVTQNQDIGPMLEMVYKDTEHKTVLIIGNVDGQAAETCALTNVAGKVKVCIVKPPVYGDQELPFLEDVAAMTGASVVPSSMPAGKVTADYLGEAEKVVVGKENTTILGSKGIKEDVQLRIDNLKKQLKSDKYNAFQRERMEMRLAKLQGKIGMIRVGGATESDAKELKFRIEDAVAATRAARDEGVVAGGGVTLAQLKTFEDNIYRTCVGEDEVQGFRVFLEAVREPLKQLMENAGEEGGYRLRQVLAAEPGFGFNVKSMTEMPVDLVKEGVIDPVKVLKSVVENAASAAGLAITVQVHVGYDREYQLEQAMLNKELGAAA